MGAGCAVLARGQMNAKDIRQFRRTRAPIWRDYGAKQHAYATHNDGFIAARSLCGIAEREDPCTAITLPRCGRCVELAAR